MRGLRRRRSSAPEGNLDRYALLAHASPEDRAIVERARTHSMAGDARLLALVDAVRYLTIRDIRGAFAECGVWRGGSVLAMILTLLELGRSDREIYLFDTFEGMTRPTEADTSPLDGPALEAWRAAERRRQRPWAELFGEDTFDESAVRALLVDSGYPSERLHFVRGPVEETLPDTAPDELALLRLDTDWYQSTLHELTHLFPRLRDGGVLIVDDYGHWEGARKAVDEYFAVEHPRLLLTRIDYTGRIAIKH